MIPNLEVFFLKGIIQQLSRLNLQNLTLSKMI